MELPSGFSWPFVPLSHRVSDCARLCLITDLKLTKNKRGPNQMINGLGLGRYLRAPGYSTSLQAWALWRFQSVCHTGPPPCFGIAPKPQFCKSSSVWHNGIFHTIEWIHSEQDWHKLTPLLNLERDCLWWCILVSTPMCWCWQVNPETALSPCASCCQSLYWLRVRSWATFPAPPEDVFKRRALVWIIALEISCKTK